MPIGNCDGGGQKLELQQELGGMLVQHVEYFSSHGTSHPHAHTTCMPQYACAAPACAAPACAAPACAAPALYTCRLTHVPTHIAVRYPRRNLQHMQEIEVDEHHAAHSDSTLLVYWVKLVVDANGKLLKEPTVIAAKWDKKLAVKKAHDGCFFEIEMCKITKTAEKLKVGTSTVLPPSIHTHTSNDGCPSHSHTLLPPLTDCTHPRRDN